MNILNLTPHDLHIVNAAGETVLFPRMPYGDSGNRFLVLRCDAKKTVIATIEGIEVTKTIFGSVDYYHVDEKGQDAQRYPYSHHYIADNAEYFIVSQLVIQASEGTHDGVELLAVGEGIRNEAGQIIAAKGLSI